MDINDVIVAPIISEKSMQDVKLHRFTFRVSGKSNKRMIKEAVKKKFKVDVLNISTTIVKGRKVRAGSRRIEIERNPWKKAIVTLPEGQKIGLFDVGGK